MTDFTAVVRDGTRLTGERRGTPSGTPVVLLHAGVADRRSWHAVLDLLEQDGLDLLAYDRRGFGDSPNADVDLRFRTRFRMRLGAVCGSR